MIPTWRKPDRILSALQEGAYLEYYRASDRYRLVTKEGATIARVADTSVTLIRRSHTFHVRPIKRSSTALASGYRYYLVTP